MVDLETMHALVCKVLEQKAFAYGILTPLEILNTVWKNQAKNRLMGRSRSREALRKRLSRRRDMMELFVCLFNMQ